MCVAGSEITANAVRVKIPDERGRRSHPLTTRALWLRLAFLPLAAAVAVPINWNIAAIVVKAASKAVPEGKKAYVSLII